MPRALRSCRFCRSQCRPQHISATSDARSATLVQILPSATSTPTHICHLGCPERYSHADSAVGNADPNTYLSLRMPGTLLSCRLCRPQCRPQHRSATSDAQSVTRLQILPLATPTSIQIYHLGCRDPDARAYSAPYNIGCPKCASRTFIPRKRGPRERRPKFRAAYSDAWGTCLALCAFRPVW